MDGDDDEMRDMQDDEDDEFLARTAAMKNELSCLIDAHIRTGAPIRMHGDDGDMSLEEANLLLAFFETIFAAEQAGMESHESMIGTTKVITHTAPDGRKASIIYPKDRSKGLSILCTDPGDKHDITLAVRKLQKRPKMLWITLRKEPCLIRLCIREHFPKGERKLQKCLKRLQFTLEKHHRELSALIDEHLRTGAIITSSWLPEDNSSPERAREMLEVLTGGLNAMQSGHAISKDGEVITFTKDGFVVELRQNIDDCLVEMITDLIKSRQR